MTYPISKETDLYKITEEDAALTMNALAIAIRTLRNHDLYEEFTTALGAASTQHPEDYEDYSREII